MLVTFLTFSLDKIVERLVSILVLKMDQTQVLGQRQLMQIKSKQDSSQNRYRYQKSELLEVLNYSNIHSQASLIATNRENQHLDYARSYNYGMRSYTGFRLGGISSDAENRSSGYSHNIIVRSAWSYMNRSLCRRGGVILA